MSPRVRHQPQNLLGDTPICSDKTVRLQYRHDWLEGIAMYPHDALDFLRAGRPCL